MKRSIFAAFALFATAACLTAEIRIGTADAIKAATSKVQPQYPAVARQMKIAGHVEIEAVIDTRRFCRERKGDERKSNVDPAGHCGG